MAKTAAFDAGNKLIDIYASGKAAKAALKGEKDIIFVTEDKFDELNVDGRFVDAEGEAVTKDQLFPAPEAKAPKAESNKPARQHVKLEGEYHIVKDNGTRFGVEDERGALHEALLANTTCEAYLEAAPKEAKYVSTKGKDSTCTSRAWFGYALKRGWIAMGPAPVVEEEEVA